MSVLLLVLLFEIKHLGADYFLQNGYMLGKFKRHGWIQPLVAHCLVHAIGTFFIAFLVNPLMALHMSLLDFSCHFIMDRIKADPDLLGRFKPLTKETYYGASEEQKRSNRWFWWSLGIDQFVHQLTHLLIIYLLVKP